MATIAENTVFQCTGCDLIFHKETARRNHVAEKHQESAEVSAPPGFEGPNGETVITVQRQNGRFHCVCGRDSVHPRFLWKHQKHLFPNRKLDIQVIDDLGTDDLCKPSTALPNSCSF